MAAEDGVEWLRGRGIGRERLAGHIGDFLAANGFKVDRSESPTEAETTVRAELARMNPAVPEGGKRIEVRLVPTSGGCAVFWRTPLSVTDADRAKLDRLLKELLQQVERSVTTGSHGTAKISRPPGARMPWEAS